MMLIDLTKVRIFDRLPKCFGARGGTKIGKIKGDNEIPSKKYFLYSRVRRRE